MTAAGYCVCVPARDEAERLPALLDALAAQTVAGAIPLALCINNSTDASSEAARDHAAVRGGRIDLLLDVCTLPRAEAHVGTARRRAMDAGAARAGASGVLIATDADCRPPAAWIEANLAAIARGADLAGGRIVVDEAEAIAPAVAAARARLDRYWADVRAIEDAADPRPHDPPPRHGDHTGASLAITVAAYRAAGGVPPLASGEDRALVEAALARGARLVHPANLWTRASPRLAGRAPGGMAAAMAAMAGQIDRGAPVLVPALDHWRSRAAWRAATRVAAGDAAVAMLEVALPPMPCDRAI